MQATVDDARVEGELPNLLPSTAGTEGFDREKVRRHLSALADGGVFLGTSSWKYSGWRGRIYTASRYATRGEFSESKFNKHSLEEYAETFRTVSVDATYYTFPTERYAEGLAAQVPDEFQFAFKVTDEITVKRFPPLPRFGERAGQFNPDFLNRARFIEKFLEPLARIRSQVGLVMFEFSRFYAPDFARGRDFVEALDGFLAGLPAEWRYGVEVRNRNLLHPDFFAMLARHRAAYLFNAWSGGPSLETQLAQPGCWTGPFGGARLLIRPGNNYEETERRLAPFENIQEPYPAGRAAAVRLIREARERSVRPLFVYFGNQFEGCAPASVAAVLDELFPPKA